MATPPVKLFLICICIACCVADEKEKKERKKPCLNDKNSWHFPREIILCGGPATLLEKLGRISLYLTDDAIAKLHET